MTSLKETPQTLIAAVFEPLKNVIIFMPTKRKKEEKVVKKHDLLIMLWCFMSVL